MRYLKIIKSITFSLLVSGFLMACEENYLDPSSISEANIFSTTEGLTGAAVGLQSKWSVGGRSPLRNAAGGSGLTVRSLNVPNAGNTAELDVFNGGNDILDNNVLVSNLWEQSLLVRNQADRIIANLDVFADQRTKESFEAWARTFKALCSGTLMQFFEQAPLETAENAEFFSREAVLEDAILNLEAARDIINSGPLAESFLEAMPGTIDLPNTINALLARFHLMNADYQNAINAAQSVDLDVISVFGYDEQNDNPLSVVILDNSAFQIINNQFGLAGALAPNAADGRLDFYIIDLDSSVIIAEGFFNSITQDLPVYLPGEMLLIQAEAHARLDQLPLAVDALNEVLTKTAIVDIYGVGASLPAYSGALTQEAILEEIYKNRRIELFLQGLSLEDSRRFQRPGPSDPQPDRTRNFYPYPQSERNNNPNTPPNPSL